MPITLDGTNGITSPALDLPTGLTVGEGGTGLTSAGSNENILLSNGTAWTSVALSTHSGFAKSLTTNGYQKLPSGLIIQWGTTGTITGPGSATVTFPIAFPNACLNIQVTAYNNSSDTASSGVTSYYSVTTTTFILYNGEDPNMTFTWLAIGY